MIVASVLTKDQVMEEDEKEPGLIETGGLAPLLAPASLVPLSSSFAAHQFLVMRNPDIRILFYFYLFWDHSLSIQICTG